MPHQYCLPGSCRNYLTALQYVRMKTLDHAVNSRLKKQKHALICPVWAVGFVLLCCSTVPADTAATGTASRCTAETESAVTIEDSPTWNATIYQIMSGSCTIRWIVRNAETGIIKHWSQCSASLSEQLPLWEKVCAAFFSSDKNAQALHTLFWGRLEPERQNASREMSLRLALAAYKSPLWDVKRGKPKSGDSNGFVRDIANRGMIYPELRDLFGRFQRSITFSCAEKFLITEASRLPFYEQLKEQGVKASGRLPFDCMAWFSVSIVSPP